MPKLRLFAADLDGTLLPNAGGQQALPGCLDRTRQLLIQLRQAGSLLCYSSPQGVMAMRKSQRTFRLPEPDYWIGHLGTEIYHLRHLDKHWQQQLGPPLDQRQIRRALAKVPGLIAQAFSKQSAHKFSWYYTHSASPEFRAQLLHLVNTTLQPPARLRLVHRLETANRRTMLDFIPDQAGNAGALYYLMNQHQASLSEVFFAGDSGADIDACIAGFCSGLVGNTLPEVKQTVYHLTQRFPGANAYFAQAAYGDGIIESLHAHHFFNTEFSHESTG